MRIGVNTRLLLKDRMEGIARYIFHTTKEMVESHPEDEFYFFFDRPFDETFIFADNVHPIHIGPPARHPFLFVIWFEHSLYKALEKYKIDVLYSGDTYLSLRTKIPTILASHDLAYIHYPNHIPFWGRMYYRYFFPKFHSKANKIIAVSNATKSDVIQQYGIDPGKIEIAFNDTDKSFAPLNKEQKKVVIDKYSEGNPYFLYLGSIHPRKNIANLIRAFNTFKSKRKTKHKLILVGRKAWNFKEIVDAYENSPYKSEIKFLGVLDEGREQLMGAAEALLYVSLFEGFGVPILEAMECNTPVICANVSSMPEVGGNAAIQVDPNNPVEIANAMWTIITDEQLKNSLIEASIEQRKKFDWKNSAETIYNAIQEARKQ